MAGKEEGEEQDTIPPTIAYHHQKCLLLEVKIIILFLLEKGQGDLHHPGRITKCDYVHGTRERGRECHEPMGVISGDCFLLGHIDHFGQPLVPQVCLCD